MGLIVGNSGGVLFLFGFGLFMVFGLLSEVLGWFMVMGLFFLSKSLANVISLWIELGVWAITSLYNSGCNPLTKQSNNDLTLTP